MIDQIRRKQLAEELRHFGAGQITNDDFEDRISVITKGNNDPVIGEIYEQAWQLYDDSNEHRLRGKYKLKKEVRHEIARWILFLHSDLEYEWPIQNRAWSLINMFAKVALWSAFLLITGFVVLVGVISLSNLLPKLLADNVWIFGFLFMPLFFVIMGLIIYFAPQLLMIYEYKWHIKKLRKYGNPDIWPFIRDEDFQRIRKQPKLSIGQENDGKE